MAFDENINNTTENGNNENDGNTGTYPSNMNDNNDQLNEVIERYNNANAGYTAQNENVANNEIVENSAENETKTIYDTAKTVVAPQQSDTLQVQAEQPKQTPHPSNQTDPYWQYRPVTPIQPYAGNMFNDNTVNSAAKGNKKQKRRIWPIFLSAAVMLIFVLSTFTAVGLVYEIRSNNHGFFSEVFGIESNKNNNNNKNSNETEKLQTIDVPNVGINQTPASGSHNEATPVVADDLLSKRELTVPEIAEKVKPTVVGIVVTVAQQSYFGEVREGEAVGTGIIMTSDGYILTNAHVVEGARKLMIHFADGKIEEARLIGMDSTSDIAVIKVDTNYDLPAAEFGDSDSIIVGEVAVAIGTPYSIEFAGTVTDGIISAITRDVMLDDSVVRKLIQTNTTINPGNSGGPLVNKYGQVIGINSVKFGMGYFEGLGFAIPTNEAIPIANQIMTTGTVKRPSMGFKGTPITAEESEAYGIPVGVDVQSVTPGGPAEKAGLQRGDIIVKVDGIEVKTVEDVRAIRNTFAVGDSISVTIDRNGREMELDLILAEE